MHMLERLQEAESNLRQRARAVAQSGGLEAALAKGKIPKLIECTLSEALVLGLLKQGVAKYFAIFGHGSTDLGNVLRIYEEEGATPPSTAVTRWRWRTPRPHCAGNTASAPRS
jgi:hypothetical protein